MDFTDLVARRDSVYILSQEYKISDTEKVRVAIYNSQTAPDNQNFMSVQVSVQSSTREVLTAGLILAILTENNSRANWQDFDRFRDISPDDGFEAINFLNMDTVLEQHPNWVRNDTLILRVNLFLDSCNKTEPILLFDDGPTDVLRRLLDVYYKLFYEGLKGNKRDYALCLFQDGKEFALQAFHNNVLQIGLKLGKEAEVAKITVYKL